MFLLVVVSMVTFAIFFLVPRLGGRQRRRTWPPATSGRTADANEIRAAADRLGFNEPVYVQYWNFSRASSSGRDYNFGTVAGALRRAVLRLLVHRPARRSGRTCWTGCRSRCRSRSAPPCIWLVAGVATGVISALRRGSIFDRAAMAIALAGVSLPIFFTGLISLAIFSYNLHITAPGGSLHADHREPG